ncbi:MAG: type II secretion system protein GspD [Bacillota bacterium]
MKKILFLTILMLIISCSLNAVILAEETEQEETNVSTVFFQTDIRDALNEVSMQTGVNIIFDRTVQGTVTLDLQDVPLEKALKMMCISGGYSYQKIDDFYLVGLPDPNSPTFQHLTKTETIKLNYLTAAEAKELLPPFYSDFIKISSSRKNIITIVAPEAVIESFKEDLKKIDLAKKQVLIKMIVTEISTEILQEKGSNFLQLFTGEASSGQSYYDYMEEAAEKGDFFLALNDGLTLASNTSHGQLLTQLQALEKEEKAEIEANPRVRVSDGSTAKLFVGEEKSLILQTGEDESSMETVDVGVTLNVTPEILNNDELRLEVAPDISHFTSENPQEFVVRRSELSTSVYAKNAKTMTLAGMTLDEIVKYESQIPVLGDIPLVRWLFRSKTKEKGERELLIFITPEIIEGGSNEID